MFDSDLNYLVELFSITGVGYEFDIRFDERRKGSRSRWSSTKSPIDSRSRDYLKGRAAESLESAFS